MILLSSGTEQVLVTVTNEVKLYRKKGRDFYNTTSIAKDGDNIPGINATIEIDIYGEIAKNNQTLYSEHPVELARYARIMLEVNKRRQNTINSVAVIGLGTGVIPRLIGKTPWTVDVYEVEEGIINWYNTDVIPKYNQLDSVIISGAIAANLSGLARSYDLVINTLPSGYVSRENDLLPRLAISGWLFDSNQIIKQNQL